MRLLGISVVATVLAAVSTHVAGSGATPTGGQEMAFRSHALQAPVRLIVSLPSRYADGGRYPVVYFLHGLPASSTAFRNIGFLRRALDTVAPQAIIVAPQAAREGESDPEYLDWGEGRNWETALSRELPAYIDSHFRTIPNRRGRALIGLSAGGYGAMLIGLHHQDTFSVIQSWSGYYHPTDPDGTSALDLGSPAANARASAHTLIQTLAHPRRPHPSFLGFYVGSGDTRFRDENIQLDAELRAAGVPHRFNLYPGGHKQTLWSAHAAEWLGLALANLTAASPPTTVAQPPQAAPTG